jgi:sugar phosphate isomerase/epimerase
MELSRRHMLKLGAGAAALCAARITPLQAQTTAKKIPIALQLYSLREIAGKDLPGTIDSVAKIGYKGIEFAGYYGRSGEQLRKILDAAGLKCCGTHIGLDAIKGDNLQRTVDFNKAMGNKYLIVASMRVPDTKAGAIEVAKLFTEAAEKVKPDGMRVGYHAHGGDFKKIEGETFWDLLFGNAGPDVAMQLDIGNCIGGGGDPYAILKKFPGRSATIHLKEHGGKSGATVGEGTVKWDEIFKLCETAGGTDWYIVEQEAYAGAPLDSVRQCFENLKKMGKV